ncbi:MAG: N-formylglutamate amidohydrolase [Bdellovibrionaceae bacterium]|nr:N-formylglutamate amidohydrolase [Pseudobdellovibrionaceae bacterium]
MTYNSFLAQQDFNTKPLFVSIPHSGEQIPQEAVWLLNKEPHILLCDVDRFVHELYLPVIEKNKIPSIYSSCHRYALDLNRLETDITEDTVMGSSTKAQTSSGLASGLYWTKTTKGDVLLASPLDKLTHKILLDKVYYPFHETITSYQKIFLKNFKVAYHLDLHSMPSYGTSVHRDNGKQRPEVVISDLNGKSASSFFVNLVKKAFSNYFEISYNWPYIGGGVTRKHASPKTNCHTVQIELRRDLYMDENSKELLPKYTDIQMQLQKCITEIYSSL